VARIDLTTDAAKPILHFGGQDETELFAEPTAHGLLVINRWAARDSDVLHVPSTGAATRLLPYGYGAHGHVVSPAHVIIYTEDEILLVGLDATVLDRAPVPGFVAASASATDVAAFASDTRLVVAHRDGERLRIEEIVFAPRFDVTTEPGREPSDEEKSALIAACTRGLAHPRQSDGTFVLVLCAVPQERVAAARELLEGLGYRIARVTPER
jgi:hypothetical protein